MALDLEAKASHALAVLADEFLAFTGGLAVLFHAVAKLQEAIVTRTLGLWASAASGVRKPGV